MQIYQGGEKSHNPPDNQETATKRIAVLIEFLASTYQEKISQKNTVPESLPNMLEILERPAVHNWFIFDLNEMDRKPIIQQLAQFQREGRINYFNKIVKKTLEKLSEKLERSNITDTAPPLFSTDLFNQCVAESRKSDKPDPNEYHKNWRFWKEDPGEGNQKGKTNTVGNILKTLSRYFKS